MPVHAPLDAAIGRFFSAAAPALLALCAACGNLPDPGAVVCTNDKDCNVGETCKEGQCVGKHDFLCNADDDCTKGLADKKWDPLDKGVCWQPSCDTSTRLCVMKPQADTFDCSTGDGADSHACTVGRCDGKGTCKHDAEIAKDRCFIGDAGKQTCVGNGDANPANPCQACNPTEDPRKWTDKKAGSSCEKAGIATCQTAVCSAAGVCEVGTAIKTGECYVDEFKDGKATGSKACVADKTTRDGSGGCVVCDASTADGQTKWSQKKPQAACDGGEECQVGQCNAAGTCVTDKIKAGWCRIADKCVKAKDTESGNVCRICDPSGAGQDKWTNVAAKTACTEDGKKCTVDACDGAGSCKHKAEDKLCTGDAGECKKNTCDPADGKCKTTALPNGATCTTDSAKCTSQTCTAGKCGAGVPDDKLCDDGIPCTIDACDAKAGCKHTPSTKPSTCDDGNACTTDACDPAGSAGKPGKEKGCLHKAKTGGTCLDDGKKCVSHTCKAGVCEANIAAGSCYVDGACHLAKAATQSGCQVCDPAKAADKWTPLAKDAKCKDDGVACTIDVCDGKGACKHDQVAASSCLIDGACVAKDAKDKTGCSSCLPLSSQTKWTPRSKGTKCGDDGVSCTEDLCDGAGKCTHDKVLATHCLIGGKCFKAGATSAAKCMTCVPSKHQGKWLPVAKGAACASDNVSCTKDTCDGAGVCKHDTQDAQCDDKLGCTWDACAPTNTHANKSTGCANIDKCPYGHACDAKKNACLSPKPVVVVQKDAANPNPTNPAVVRHVLDAKLGLSRTWVAFQSQACATASGGKWSISQGAELRAAVLDDQVVPAGKKVKPPVVSFAAHLAGGQKAGVCQGFPAVAADPQSSTQAWVHWLEADTKKKTCITAAGQGGVLRFALLDTSKVKQGQAWTKVSGSTCLNAAPNFPLFLTPAFAPLDGSAGTVASVGKRAFLSARPNGFGLNSAPLNQLVGAGAASSLKWSTVNPSGAFSQVRPVLLDSGVTKAGQARYWLLALSKEGSRHRLQATGFDAAGKKLKSETWLDSTTGVGKTTLSGATVCDFDATSIGSTFGALLATVDGSSQRMWALGFASGKATFTKKVHEKSSLKTDCRRGVSTGRITVLGNNDFGIAALEMDGAHSTSTLYWARAKSSGVSNTIVKPYLIPASDDAGVAPLAGRGIAAPFVMNDGGIRLGYEASVDQKKAVVVHTRAP